LVVHDTITNCYSQPYPFTIDAPVFNDPVTTISYTTPVCIDNANLLPNTSATGFTTGGTYSSTTGLAIDPATGEINVAGSVAGAYTVTYSVLADATNCINSGSSSFNIVINPATQATFAPLTFCEDAAGSLPTSSIEGFTGTWELGGAAVSTIDTSVSGNYTYDFIPTAGQCASAGTLAVVIDPKIAVTFDNLDACIGAQIDFPTTSIEGFQLPGTWTPSVVNTSVSGATTYTFVPTDICYDEATFTVSLNACTIPKGFSPNGDGNNDTWDLSAFDIRKVEVYNRYGLKVYSKTSYTDEWGGKADNGNDLPTGTYYFMIEFNDRPSETGWVYINRGE
jgi:gliding motility-associated-like protein